MKIEFTKSFLKNFEKRLKSKPKVKAKFKERLNLLEQNIDNPLLRVHPLIGNKKDLWAFSVTGDYRAVFYFIDNDHIVFVDIGTHNQVY